MKINKMRDHHQGYNSLLSRSVERGLEVPLPPPLHLSRNKYILFAHSGVAPPDTSIAITLTPQSHMTNHRSRISRNKHPLGLSTISPHPQMLHPKLPLLS